MKILLTIALVFHLGFAARANQLTKFQSVCDTDMVSGGIGGLMNKGNGTITLPPFQGHVKQAILYWHGQILVPAGNQPDKNSLLNGTFAGRPIAGTHIGFSGKNGWEPYFQASQSVRADVTSILNQVGQVPYTVSFPTNVSGASLIIFYDDEDSSNNRDLIIYDGNDSNDKNSFDAVGWNTVLTGFTYSGGNVNLELHVSDGQLFLERDLLLNGLLLQAGPDLFSGTTVPAEDNFALFDPAVGIKPGNTRLWDIKKISIPAHLLTAGPQSWAFTTGVRNDLFSLVVAIIDAPRGSANECGLPPAGNRIPSVVCPAPLTVEATQSTGVADTLLKASITDLDGGTIVVQWKVNGVPELTEQVVVAAGVPAQISFNRVFAPGKNNMVELTVSDGIAEPITCTITVTVVEPIPPVITSCGPNLTFTANAQTGFILPDLKGTISATDNNTLANKLVVKTLPAAGTRLPVGFYELVVSVMDEAGNTTICQKTLEVLPDPTVPNSPPQVTCSTVATHTIVAEVTGGALMPDFTTDVGVIDDYTPREFIIFKQTPTVGTPLAPGTYTVLIEVRDEYQLAGIGSPCTLTLVVLPNLIANNPPVIDCSKAGPMILDAGLAASTLMPDLRSLLTATDDTTPITKITYTQNPAPGSVLPLGTHIVTFVAYDLGAAASAPCTVELKVIKNTLPVADTDSLTVQEDIATLTPNVLENDYDSDIGDIISVSTYDITSLRGGTVVYNNDGTFLYTPPLNYSGNDSFKYTIRDLAGLTSTTTVYLQITPQNDPPAALNDTIATTEDVPVTTGNVLANDTDSDEKDPLTALKVISFQGTSANGGTVTYNNDGTFYYVPAPHFNGADLFDYTIADSAGLNASAKVLVTVIPVNDPPVAVQNSYQTLINTPVTTGLVLANDYDPDNQPIALVSVDSTSTSGGQINNFGNGTFEYIPPAGFIGQDIFYYVIKDPAGLTAIGKVVINVKDPNAPPIARNDSYTTQQNLPLTTGLVLVNDEDLDGTPIAVVSHDPSSAFGGLVSYNGNGTFYYIPPANFFGVDTFLYSIQDAGGSTASAVVSITVLAANPPIANADEALTAMNAPVTISVLSNDLDLDGDFLSITATSNPSQGSVIINVDGTITYTPETGFFGVDTFTYTITDGKGGFDLATVTITIPMPIASVQLCDLYPIALHISKVAHVQPGASIGDVFNGFGYGNFGWLTWAGSTSEPTLVKSLGIPGDSYTYTNPNNVFDHAVSVGDWVQGSTGVINGSAVRAALDLLKTIDIIIPVYDVAQSKGASSLYHVVNFARVRITDYYLPNQNRITATFLGFTMCDGVVQPNVAPAANDDSAQTVLNTPVQIAVLGNDSDTENQPLTVSIVSGPSRGTVVVNGNNMVTYTPANGFVGVDQFTYKIADSAGGTDTAVVTITVSAPNRPPVAVNDSAITAINTGVVIQVLSNDSDPDRNPLTIVSCTYGVNGSTTVTSNNTILYTPDNGFFGLDAFSYTISDGKGGIATTQVNVTVVKPNSPPVAADDSVQTTSGVSVIVPVFVNDSDPDNNPLTVVSVTQPAGGSVIINADKTLTYKSKASFTGVDSFTYAISDGKGGTDTAQVLVTVLPANRPPVAVDDTVLVIAGSQTVISVLSNDSDPDGDTITIVSATQGAKGTVTVNANGTISYIADANSSGTDIFSYTITDGKGSTAKAYVRITITPVAGGCDLYPIALHISNVQNVPIGGVITDVYNGNRPGNFGWLTWAGSVSEPTLHTSLGIPGNSYTYINPFNSADRRVSIGDWVQGATGLMNSAADRAALNKLKTIDIVIPVFDVSKKNGANSLFHVVNFAKVRILDYHLPQQNRITARFLGFTQCGN